MRGFRGKVRIPCANNRCMVIRDGKEVRSEMILVTETRMGRLLDEPFYRCEREGCWYRENPIAVTEGNFAQFVTEDYRWKRRGEKPGQNVPEALVRA